MIQVFAIVGPVVLVAAIIFVAVTSKKREKK